jgi:predicted DNA binding CopG/RHH family protein
MHKKRLKTMKKILPKITSDEEAESLLSEDLSEYLTPENFKETSRQYPLSLPLKTKP